MLDHVRASRDTTVKVTLFEDSAAMIGLVLAALGLALRQATGPPAGTARRRSLSAACSSSWLWLGLDSRDFLIGRAADPEVRKTIRAEIENTPGVDALLDLRTIHVGPVAARVAFSDEISADRAGNVADNIDRRPAAPGGAGRGAQPGKPQGLQEDKRLQRSAPATGSRCS